MAFSQAVSGLNAAATNLDVIGNNIANSATYGFKSGTASFADMFAGSKVGLGVKLPVSPRLYRWHDHQHRAWSDVAISQNGFSVWWTATVRCSTAVTDNLSWMKP